MINYYQIQFYILINYLINEFEIGKSKMELMKKNHKNDNINTIKKFQEYKNEFN